MMRRIAVVGDQLDNGGEVGSYEGPQFLIHGHQAALIGGEVYCPVCKTTGYIAKDGGPRRMNFFISEIAAHDDVVVCGCPEHPRIFAQLSREAWYDDMAETLGVVGSHASATASSLVSNTFDEQVRAVGHGASDGYPYYVETSDGHVYSGRLEALEADSKLTRIDTGATAGHYTIYWGDEALAMQGNHHG